MLIESDNGNVFDGYLSSGWKSGDKSWNRDEQSHVFNIRSSKGYSPSICDIKPEFVDYAMGTCKDFYFWFGKDVINLSAFDGLCISQQCEALCINTNRSSFNGRNR